jgi:hypothetical protein
MKKISIFFANALQKYYERIEKIHHIYISVN